MLDKESVQVLRELKHWRNAYTSDVAVDMLWSVHKATDTTSKLYSALRTRVRRRLFKLAEAGLVEHERIDTDYWSITDAGREYLKTING